MYFSIHDAKNRNLSGFKRQLWLWKSCPEKPENTKSVGQNLIKIKDILKIRHLHETLISTSAFDLYKKFSKYRYINQQF